ncbi:MAG: hypothetical protein NVS2B2_38330 [Ktedonobacteraceae bacterium]
MTLNTQSTPIVRYIEQVQPPRPLTIDPPLRVLGMIASPKDLEELDVEHERQRVEKALEHLQKNGFVQLTWLDGRRWQDVQRSMRYGPWHIFHFVGHGGFDARLDEGILAFENDEGLAHSISATQLGRLLADHRSLRLVVLNSCDGARGSQRDIFSSAAATLIRRNIPAVLAMQYEITDRAALIFSQTFYEALADNIPVDAAVSEARKAISIGIENSLEWGTPVLYLRSPDGNLFNINIGRMLTSSLDVSKSLSPSTTFRASVSSAASTIRVSTLFDDGPLRSIDSDIPTDITFYNSSESTAAIYWLNEHKRLLPLKINSLS